MHVYMGSFTPGSTIYMMFNTQDLSGAPITLSGGTIRVYKNGSTTESAGTGITLTADFDGRTGLHNITLDTSGDATFYADGSECFATLTAGTVDGVSVVGKVVAQFTLAATANVPVNIIQISGDATAADNAESFFDGTGYAGTNNVIPSVTTVTGNVNGNVGGSVASVTTVNGIANNVITAASINAAAITAAKFAADAIDANAIAATGANEIADALLDRASAVEGFTTRQLLRLFAAALVGKADGLAGTTAHYRDVADSKNRITATVDADGNRTAVTLDAT